MRSLNVSRAAVLTLMFGLAATGARASKEAHGGQTRDDAIKLLQQHSKPGTVGKVMSDTAGVFHGILKYCGSGEQQWSPMINHHYEDLAKKGELDKPATASNLEQRAREETEVWKQTDSKLGKHTPSCTRANILKFSAFRSKDLKAETFVDEELKDSGAK